MTPEQRIRELLRYLYGEAEAARVWLLLASRLADFRAANPGLGADPAPLTEKDAILITYGDQFSTPGQHPLHTLKTFLDRYLCEALSGVHILPCFPYSSDDGFSVIDYKQIDPDLGDWRDISALGSGHRLMFDAVINHVSQHSAWFQGFRRGEEPWSGYFITVEPKTDLSAVVRPRALPLLTPVETPGGVRHVWTTFSEDQIDLNYENPAVQLEIVDVLLHYAAHGAEIIRLDAIAYLWKEIGTTCIHLPQTHAVVKLWRAVLDAVAPGVILITETNVPHAENISYFGDLLPETGRTDEAQLVYNFPLAPLVLHSFVSGDASVLSAWAASLETPPGATFFNFIASHDGMGMRPAEGILTADEVSKLVEQTLAHGGQVGWKGNPDGSRSVYELNITLYDFLNDPAEPNPDADPDRFLASQAILLALAGVPGIYVHSLFGSRNCHELYAETGRARSLNREKFVLPDLEVTLADPASHLHRVFDGYRRMLRMRRQHPAFNPQGRQEILDINPHIFAVVRTAPDGAAQVVCLVNVSSQPTRVDLSGLPNLTGLEANVDLLSGEQIEGGVMTLGGYGVVWLG